MHELSLSYTGFAYYLKEMYGFDNTVFIKQGDGHITLFYSSGKTMIMELNNNAEPNICGNVYTNIHDLFIVLTKSDTLNDEQKNKYNQFVQNCLKQWQWSKSPYKHCSISKDNCLRCRLEITIKDNKKIRCYCPCS
jgi:hypothetical protein